MKNSNDDDHPLEPNGSTVSGTQGFVIGALAAAALIILVMAVLSIGFFDTAQPAKPFSLQSGSAVSE